ncbi:MAG: DUF4058 family protein [Elainellaceae cyanobacterium]
MPTKPPFPGMNPYLESPYRWPEIHHALISEMARTLNLQIVPKCRAAIEARVYIDTALVGIPNIYVHKRADANARSSAVAVSAKPERVRLPTPCEVTEGYLEIREPLTKRVVTVVEVLSPANKRSGEGRRKYLEKRQTVLASATHFVEIDLLRQGEPMPLASQRRADYQILVSRSNERPSAERYAFTVQEPIPKFLLPLEIDDTEPVVDLKARLEQVCQNTAVDIDIDYTAQPQPALPESDWSWLRSLPQGGR